MRKMKNLFLFLIGFLVQISLYSQQLITPEPNNANGLMRSEGKIFVVMAVAFTILIGLIWYVWTLDKKISGLEKQENL